MLYSMFKIDSEPVKCPPSLKGMLSVQYRLVKMFNLFCVTADESFKIAMFSRVALKDDARRRQRRKKKQ